MVTEYGKQPKCKACGEPLPVIGSHECSPTYQELEAVIDGFWDALHNSYNVESRPEIEKDTKDSWAKGTSPLLVALHYVWKREPKVADLEAELDCLKSETIKTMTLCKCTKSYRLPTEKVCKVCRIAELEAELLASKREANDLRLELISADMHGTD